MNEYWFLDNHKGKIVVVPNPYVKWKEEREKYLYNGTINDEHLLREIMDDEIIIEYDDCTRDRGIELINKTKDNLKGKVKYHIYDHNGKSPHLHIYGIKGLAELDDETRKRYKEQFIQQYAAADNFDSSLCGAHLIALEYKPHFKGDGRGVKALVEVSEEDIQNKLDKDILKKVKASQKIFNIQKQETLQADDEIIFKDVLEKFQSIRFPEGDRNNKISKNICIGLIKYGYSSQEIEMIFKKISQVQPGISISSLNGWLDKAIKGELTEFNSMEILNWAFINDIDIASISKLNVDESYVKLETDLSYYKLKKISRTNYKKKGRVQFLVNNEVSIKGKIINSSLTNRESVVLMKEIERKRDKDNDIRDVTFFDEPLDTRTFRVIDELTREFYIYNLYTEGKQYMVLSENRLDNKEYIITGTKIEVNNKADIIHKYQIGIKTPFIIATKIESSIKTYNTPSEMFNALKKYNLNRDKFMDFIFSGDIRHQGFTLRHPPLFEDLICSWLFSGKIDGYPLHFMMIAKPGTGKSALLECIHSKMNEMNEVLEGSASTIKSIIPSFRSASPNPGLFLLSSRIAFIDEFLRLLERIPDNENRAEQLAMMNSLLEHRRRTMGGGNSKIESAQMQAKLMAICNPIKGYPMFVDLIEHLEGSFFSRIMVWYQDKDHIEYINKQKQIHSLPKLSFSLPIEEWLSIYDFMQSFIVPFDNDRINEINNSIGELVPESIHRLIYSARYDHHIRCLFDGIVKLRCFIERDETFKPKEEDYDKLKTIWKLMVKNWISVDKRMLKRADLMKYLTNDESIIIKEIRRKGGKITYNDLNKFIDGDEGLNQALNQLKKWHVLGHAGDSNYIKILGEEDNLYNILEEEKQDEYKKVWDFK